jgi:ribose transport system substrate-binding protein/D-allose transport system substrate-binding protein
MKNKLLAALIVLTCLISTASRAEEKGEYIFILKARGNPYWQAVVDGITETAKAKGIKASVHQLQNDTAAEEQLNICEAVLAKKPKMIVISSVTPAVGIQCMKKAAAQGVLVADQDANVLPEDAKKAGFPLAFSVGSDNYLIGENAASYLQKISASDHPKILVLEGAAGSVPGQKRADGFKDKIAKLMPKAKIAASISAEWDRLKAINITNDVLQREPKLDVIYAANDLMALGAAEAVRTAGKQAQIKIIGVDGTADARKAVTEGRLTATVAQLPYLIGKRGVEKSIDVVAGRKTEQMEITPTPVLTKDMLQAKADPLLQYVK